jgi:hypothetical protein
MWLTIVRFVGTDAGHVSTLPNAKPVQTRQSTSTLKTNASPAHQSRTAANNAPTRKLALLATLLNILTPPLTPPTTRASAPRLTSPTTISARHATMGLISVQSVSRSASAPFVLNRGIFGDNQKMVFVCARLDGIWMASARIVLRRQGVRSVSRQLIVHCVIKLRTGFKILRESVSVSLDTGKTVPNAHHVAAKPPTVPPVNKTEPVPIASTQE